MNSFDTFDDAEDFTRKNEMDQDQVPIITRLHPSIEPYVQAPLAQRIPQVLQDRPIRYPAFDTVVGQAEWMIYEPELNRARGLVVSSERGNGKTTIAKLLQAHYNDRADPDRPSVVSISMSGARDARTVFGRILETLGSPARISHRVSDREMLVCRLLDGLGCRLLVLDEVQDIVLGSEREQQRALEGIKFLMNELKLHVIGFGTEKAFQALASDPHLEARFTEFVLPRWKADSTLANFLATYERYLPFEEASNLGSADVVKLLAKVGGGTLGKTVSRVQNAALAAMIEGAKSISMKHLETATTRPAQCVLKPGKLS